MADRDRQGSPIDRAYLAVDLGAGSGRVILGRFCDSGLELEELHRFPQPVARRGDHERWLFDELLAEVASGLRAACQQDLVDPAGIRSVGVDGWGVDYSLLDQRGVLLEDPVCYRDGRTDGKLEELIGRVGAEQIYARTGIQFMPINTAVQLFAQVEAGEWPAAARRLLMVPDLVHLHLSGIASGEVSNASTTQLLNAGSRDWDGPMLGAVGVDREVMPPLVQPGTLLGKLRADLRESIGLAGLVVVAPATHDTASAVAGTPLEPGWAYLSSGTWSLLGLETGAPVLTADALRLNVTNEAGVEGRNLLLKNMTGLWILESCRRIWKSQGIGVTHEELLAGLRGVEPGHVFIDVDAPRFLNPGNMVEEIRTSLAERGLDAPGAPAGFARMILESLALRCAEALDQLREVSGEPIRGLHVIGGGSRNDFLNQALSSATALPVRAGPAEAATTGNILVQAVADGVFPDHAAARRFLAGVCSVRTLEPLETGKWAEARARFRTLSA